MKNLIALVLLISSAYSGVSQVGINTTNPDPSAILDVESTTAGLLIPRLTTLQRNAILNPANGLIIYNTDNDELQINTNTTATPVWEAVNYTPAPTLGQSFKYSNTDVTTNVNQTAAINLPVFGTVTWNDNAALYAVNAANNTVTIAETGRYKVIVNASVDCNASARRAPEMFLNVNGTQIGTTASTGYMRRANGHDESSLHLNEVIELTAGDVLSVSILRSAQNGLVTLRAIGTTNIYIEKIR